MPRRFSITSARAAAEFSPLAKRLHSSALTRNSCALDRVATGRPPWSNRRPKPELRRLVRESENDPAPVPSWPDSYALGNSAHSPICAYA